MDIGIRDDFKRLRKQRRVSIVELSKRTGICRNTISAYENNKSEISVEKLEQLAIALGARIVIKVIW